MAFPSDTGTKLDTLASAWEGARSTAASIKGRAASLRDLSLAGPVNSSGILDFLTNLIASRTLLARYASVSGIGAYAQEQVADNMLNVTAEFSAMTSACDSTRDWIVANFPKDGSSYLLAKQFNGGGQQVDRQFSTAALAGLRTQLDALIATID